MQGGSLGYVRWEGDGGSAGEYKIQTDRCVRLKTMVRITVETWCFQEREICPLPKALLHILDPTHTP
jgi:hypothetical protein